MADALMNHRELLLRTDDGAHIAIDHHFSGNNDAVIVAPGFFQSKGTLTYRRIIRGLRRRYDVVAMDFRGHGRSTGRYTFSSKEAADLDRVARYASLHHERLWVLGFSYGGSIALLTQYRTPRFAGIICVGSPMDPAQIELEWWRKSSFRSGRRSLERGTGCRIGSVWSPKLPAVEAVRLIADIPLCFIHGDEDRIVYPRHSVGLYEAASGLRSLRIIAGGGHAEDLFRTHETEMWDFIFAWFEHHIPGKLKGSGITPKARLI